MSENKGILVYSEDKNICLELLGKGRQLANELNTNLTGILIGHNVTPDAEEFNIGGADKVIVVDNPELQSFNTEVYADIITELASREKPELLLIGATKRGKDIAPKIATRLETGCVTECVKFDADTEKRTVQMGRVVYAGQALAVQICQTKPQIATVPPRTFEKSEDKERKGQIEKADFQIKKSQTEMVETREKKLAGAKIEDARIVVRGGRGIKNKEDFELLEELAAALQGQISCSRPIAADRGWFNEWIGLSGHNVKPSLYVACGVSGAIQHIAGIRDSDIIVAINDNPEAPIFSEADYGIVGNIYEIVPEIVKALKNKK